MSNYNADSIQVLEDLEHVRKRVSMYLGSADADGIYHAWKELINNSCDEYLAGFSNSIVVQINTNEGWVLVSDNGRGIPVEVHAKTGISTLTTVLTNLQAGGKFSTDKDRAYTVSSGLHGIGLKATNAVSEWLHISVWRKGVCHTQSFSRGKPVQPVAIDKARNKLFNQGTEIKFKPDDQIFGQHKLPVQKVQQTIQELSYLCPGLRFTFDLDGVVTHHHAQQGLGLLVTKQSEGQPLLGKVLEATSDDGTITFACLWANNDDETEHWWSYCNLSGTPDHGTHVTGLKRALTKSLSGLAKASVTTSDFRCGLYAAIHVKVAEPQFRGQTKDALCNSATETDVFEWALTAFTKFWENNPTIAKAIVDRAVKFKKARDKYKQLKNAISSVTTVSRDARGLLPAKLVEAPGCKPEERELFICEGASAAGSAIAARKPYQEILALRGKIINCQRAEPALVLKNEEIQSIIMATGVPVDPTRKATANDMSTLRVGKLMLLCDADPDGCWHGSCRVKLLDGTTPTFKELNERYPNGESFWVYSLDKNKQIVPALAHNVHITKQVTELLEMQFDDGSMVQCTPDHLFALRAHDDSDRIAKIENGIAYMEARYVTPYTALASASGFNHLCEAKLVTTDPVPVYDMTVDTHGNYMLANGVFVHNCHITTLALSFIVNYMPTLVEQGRVYVVRSPLYRATNVNGTQMWFGDNLQEVEKLAGCSANKLLISRLKGHGECSANELNYYAMDPATRKLTKLLYSQQQHELFASYMGNDSDVRKVLLGI